MTTDNWINLIAAILIGGGTLALAFMTWKSIRQTRSIQKSSKREILLNEISEWLIANANFRMHFTAWEKERFLVESLIIIESLQNLYVKGVSLERIIRSEWPELAKNIEEVIALIGKIIDVLLKDEIDAKEKNAVALLLKNQIIESTGKAFEIVDRLKVRLLNA